MRYLVLGSSGSIGSNLCIFLRSKGHVVTEFDIKNSDLEDLRIPSNPKLENVIMDVDLIFFLAFDVGGSKYLNHNDKNFDFILNNTQILVNTFQVIKNFRKDVIFISSYMADFPSSSYAILKKLGENFTHSVDGLVVRLYNVYCKEDYGVRSHVLSDMIEQARLNNKIVLRTDGNEIRQFLFIDDCCEGLYIISTKYAEIKKEDSTIDLSSFEWINIRELASIVSGFLNCSVEFSLEQASYDHKSVSNKQVLQFWTPSTSLHEGISRIINN